MPETTSRRLAALDGLRLVAALAVAAYHWTNFWAIDGVHAPYHYLPTATRATIYGFLGVELFFMISGFAICMSSWGRSLGAFVASRAARLYPAYWVCIVLTLVVTTLVPLSGYVPVYDEFSAGDVAVNFTMLQEPLGVHPVDNVYWTLWAELRFYLLFGLVVARGVTYRRTVLFCAGWMLLACAVPLLDSRILRLILVAEFAGYFVAGIVLYLMYRFGPTPLLWAMLAFTWLINVHQLEARVGLKPGFAVPLWPAVLLITLAYGVLVLVALHRTDRIDWRWLTVAGALTYPFYLLHQRIGYVLIRHGVVDAGLPPVLVIPATGALLLIPAWLVYRFVERPFGPRLRAGLLRGIAAARALPPAPSRRLAADVTDSRSNRTESPTGVS
jgi:peptidoglycan/LPS O-acetylase OafA/YrhL